MPEWCCPGLNGIGCGSRVVVENFLGPEGFTIIRWNALLPLTSFEYNIDATKGLKREGPAECGKCGLPLSEEDELDFFGEIWD